MECGEVVDVMIKEGKMGLGELRVCNHFLLTGCQASKGGHRKSVPNLSNGREKGQLSRLSALPSHSPSYYSQREPNP